MTAGAMRSRIPHADLWALGILFFTSRAPWILDQIYHSDPRAAAFLFVTSLVSLLLIAAGYAFARFIDPRTLAVLMRDAVLAMFLFNVAIQLRQVLPEDAGLKMSWKLEVLSRGWYWRASVAGDSFPSGRGCARRCLRPRSSSSARPSCSPQRLLRPSGCSEILVRSTGRSSCFFSTNSVPDRRRI